MGAYSYIYPRFCTATEKLAGKRVGPKYIGRLASAATATGKAKNHAIEQQLILDAAITTN
jgi:2-oxoglutarate dehydrogenase complex dehydrogenase (E1) component-like enzyme